MDESTRKGPLWELLGFPVEITIHCGCTRVIGAPIHYFLNRLGPDATIAEGERRMICRTCRERARLVLKWTWAADPIRRHGDGEPLPAWCHIT